MELRPCIDIHNGKVKQIVGGTLEDEGDSALENFVSKRDADFFAKFYQDEGLFGGHVIMLNRIDSEYYEATKQQALKALRAFPQGLQIGGGITPENAKEFLDAGASHVIVTSYIFHEGIIDFDRLNEICNTVGKEHLVLDLSCRRKGDDYYVVTDRWQNFTKEKVDTRLLDTLSDYCDEFLIHAADVEGKQAGVENDLIDILASWDKIPMTYAGGIGDYDDILSIKEKGNSKLNVTVGSALDLFGGPLNYETVQKCVKDV